MASTQLAKVPVALRSGADFLLTVTFRRDGVPTQVEDVRGEVRDSPDSSGTLIIDLTEHQTQASPGVVVFAIPGTVTETYEAGNYSWDLFGTVSGTRIKLVDVSSWKVIGRVTEDPA